MTPHYSYKLQRPNLFTEHGLKLFVAFRDKAMRLLEEAGAFQLGAIGLPENIGAAEQWDIRACADLMLERGELRVLNPDDEYPVYTSVERGR